MGLADTFQTIVDSLPDDWTDLELDLRLAGRVALRRRRRVPDDLQRAALLPPRLALAAARRPPLRPRRLGADRPRHARLCSTTPASRASWSCARCARDGSRSRRCGAARSRCAKTSAACARSRSSSSWRAWWRWSRTCCSAPRCRACSRRPVTRWSWSGTPTGYGSDWWIRPAVLVVDLVDRDLDGAALVESLTAEGLLGRTRTLGFYSHVDAPARERAERAGFDLVVPRSRMAREGAALVTSLVS